MFHIKILAAVVFTISNLFQRGLYEQRQLTGGRRVLSRGVPDFIETSLTVEIVSLRSEVLEERTPSVAGFLVGRERAQAQFLSVLLKTGDNESNPSPDKCCQCEVTMRTGPAHFSCVVPSCQAKCHKKTECSDLSRYKREQAWR